MEIGCVFQIAKADTLKREQIEPVKIAVVLFLIILTIVSYFVLSPAISLYPYEIGVIGLYPSTILGLFFVGVGVITYIYYFQCAYLVNKRAPTTIEKYSRIYLEGVFLVLL